MCYRDRAFCAQSEDCANDNCTRKFGEKDKVLAEKWWGGEDYPVAMSPFKYTTSCEGYIPTEKKMYLFDEDRVVIAVKDFELRQENDRVVVGIGEPYMYNYQDLLDYPSQTGTICVDAQGRNFDSNTSVYIDYDALMHYAKVVLEDVSTSDSTP